ncbi:DMT family transporter [Candidatus Woesearchaeota archaeon]|nr:DMT family transporter [Candidatus Woesearchaeota archaeon]
MIPVKNRGLFYAVLSSLFLSTGFIFARHFLNYTNPETLNTLWFGIAFAVSIAVLLARSPGKTVRTFRLHWKDGIVVGGANAVAAAFWFHAINITGPTLTAFLVRFSTIFIIILGILFLKEKLHIHDIAGMLIALAGAFAISFANGDYLNVGTLVALAASLAIAVHQVLSKVYVKTIEPLTLVSLRTLFTALFLLVYALAFSKLQPFPISQLPLLTAAIVVNAIFGFVFFYKALELTDVSRVAIIRTLDPFIVVLYALALFHTLPALNEFVGGLLVVSGVLVTMYGHSITTMLRTVKWLPWFG